MPAKKTNKEFIDEVYNLVGNEYTVLSEYTNNKTKINILHNKCNNIYKVAPIKFISGRRCPYCAIPSPRKLTNDEFINRFYNIFSKTEYKLLSNYINSDTDVTIKHIKCNNIFKARPYNLLKKNNTKCPYCYGHRKLTNDEFVNRVKILTNNEYIFLEDYVNSDTKIKVLHTVCNNIYTVRPYDFFSNSRCPYCKHSKGEEYINKWLTQKNFLFEEQYKIKDCKYINVLPFDFKLECEDNTLILIEYDGEQHFKPIYGEEELKLQQKRDNIKNEYCKNHSNIDFYRISYKDFNKLDKVLEDIFSNYD